MKTITIITEEISDKAMAAVLHSSGVVSVTVTEDRAAGRNAVAVENFHGLRNLKRFSPNHRIDVVLDDATVDALFESITVAYEAGFFSAAEAWVNTDLTAAA